MYFSAGILKACRLYNGQRWTAVARGEYITIKNAPTIDLVARPHCFQLLCKPTQSFILATVVSIREMVSFSYFADKILNWPLSNEMCENWLMAVDYFLFVSDTVSFTSIGTNIIQLGFTVQKCLNAWKKILIKHDSPLTRFQCPN